MAPSSIWLCGWLIQQLKILRYNDHMVKTREKDHKRCLADTAANVCVWSRNAKKLFHLCFLCYWTGHLIIAIYQFSSVQFEPKQYIKLRGLLAPSPSPPFPLSFFVSLCVSYHLIFTTIFIIHSLLYTPTKIHVPFIQTLHNTISCFIFGCTVYLHILTFDEWGTLNVKYW